MKIKHWLQIVCCLGWAIFMIVVFYNNADGAGVLKEYTIANDYVEVGDEFYIIDNSFTEGIIYSLAPEGTIGKLFHTGRFAQDMKCSQIISDGETTYVLVEANTQKDGKQVSVYNVLKFNEQLEVTATYNWFIPGATGTISEMSEDEEFIYITQITKEANRALLYTVKKSDFVEYKGGKKSSYELRNVSTIYYSAFVDCDEDSIIAYAKYDDGKLIAVENGTGLADDYLYSDTLAKIYDNRDFTIGQIIEMNHTKAVWCIIGTIAGIVFIYSLIMVLYDRNRVVYLIMIWELMLVGMSYAGYSTIVGVQGDQRKEEVITMSGYSLDSAYEIIDELKSHNIYNDQFYTTDTYNELTQKLHFIKSNYGNGEIFEDIAVVYYPSGTIIASGIGYDRANVEDKYGKAGLELIGRVHKYGGRLISHSVIGGERYVIMANARAEIANPDYILLATMYENSVLNAGVDSLLIISLGLSFALFSILGCTVLLLQSRDLKKLSNSMEEVSNQSELIPQKPAFLGVDMSDLWNGVLDMDRSMRNLIYSKFRIYEAYYRFAPKSVEKLLGKSSIIEVNPGDRIYESGTIAVFKNDVAKSAVEFYETNSKLGKNLFLKYVAGIFDLINEYQKNEKGYQISVSSDLSDIRMLLPQENRNASELGIGFHKLLMEGSKLSEEYTVVMHYARFAYGVVGSKEQNTQYLICPDMMEIESCIDQLNRLSLNFIITETVYERELELPENRYIGFLELSDGRQLKLYEITEACENADRRAKKELADKFNEGLELFYAQDFYLARNIFARILRDNPMDYVARWYAFTCEKYLNEPGEEIHFGLNQ